MENKSIYNRFVYASAPDTTQNGPVWLFVFKAEEVLMEVINDNFTVPVKAVIKELGFQTAAKYYLGKFDGCDCYLIETDDKTDVPDGMVFKKFRSLFGRIDEEIFLLAGRAYQILSWNRKNRYCGRCGSANEMKPDELAKVCPNCGNITYPKISPAIIVGVLNGNKILLAQSRYFKEKEKIYSIIAGFVEPGETFEDCLRREVFEEVGLKIKNPRYFGSQPWPFPDSLMVGFTADYDSGQISVDGDEIISAGWFSKENMPNTPPTSSIAGKIIDWYYKKSD